MKHPKSPEDIFEDLFFDFHLSKVLEDGKNITDAIPQYPPEQILEKYQNEKTDPDFDIKSFFEEHFDVPHLKDTGFRSDVNSSVKEHIEKLWDVLSRESLNPVKGSSALPLPYPYIVPGGRFNEIYYWDSFFTMLGLKESGRIDMIENMINNFAYMIDNYGFIPNGSRTYFLSRSQPPFFAMMVDLLASVKGDDVYVSYLKHLKNEYRFWMKGHDDIQDAFKSKKRVVRIEDGHLNRYFDELSTPRPEMYGTDVHEFKESGREAQSFYKNMRAACESGWDFSSRWMSSSAKLSSIHTTHLLPVDLNCLLYFLEKTLSKAFGLSGDEGRKEKFERLASQRAQLITKWFWSSDLDFFMDYDFRDRHLCYVRTLAGMFPLYFGLATKEQAAKVVKVLEDEFLVDGGLRTTIVYSGQQWDAPNGWAPLQWICIQGLRKYGYDALADTVKERWLNLNDKVFKNTGKMLEKYNVEDADLETGGGEYPVQDGFGWTNGVYLSLINEE